MSIEYEHLCAVLVCLCVHLVVIQALKGKASVLVIGPQQIALAGLRRKGAQSD